MSLTVANAGDTIYSSTINQLINVLQAPAGAQEKGKYKLEMNAYSTSAFISCPITTLSSNSTPVSASIDTADNSPFDVGTPNTGHLTQGGMQIYAQVTTVNTIADAGGNWTMQY